MGLTISSEVSENILAVFQLYLKSFNGKNQLASSDHKRSESLSTRVRSDPFPGNMCIRKRRVLTTAGVVMRPSTGRMTNSIHIAAGPVLMMRFPGQSIVTRMPMVVA